MTSEHPDTSNKETAGPLVTLSTYYIHQSRNTTLLFYHNELIKNQNTIYRYHPIDLQ